MFFRFTGRGDVRATKSILKKKAAKGRRLRLECLENRRMLSADPITSDIVVTEPAADTSVDDSTAVATPLIDVTPDASGTGTPSGYSPAQISQAYGFNLVSGNGAGTTIAIVDAYNNPNIAADLKAFDTQFGLAAPPNFTVVSQTGSTTALPANNKGWSLEIALDVEWAHAIAPGANILLVEAKSSSLTDLMAAEDYARNAAGVVVVSNSWGASEFSTETSYDKHFTTPAGHQGVSFMVAAGDDGTPAEYPSSSPDVLSVGGTTLKLNANGTYSSETVWSDGGGGASRYEAKPSFQANVNTGGTHRGTPDVSLDADPSTGFAVYDTYGASGWVKVGGTSASTPVWAALVAIADGSRISAGKGSLSNVQSALYTLPSSDFHDITKGNNGSAAKAGYDLASGLGSPYANLVINDLIAFGGATSFTMTAQTTQTFDLSWLWSLFGAVETDGGGGDVAGVLAAEFTNASASSSAMVSTPQLSSGGTVASFVTSSVASVATVTPVAAPVAMRAAIPFGSRFDFDESEFETWLSDTKLSDTKLSDTKLSDTKLSDTKLSDTKLSDTKLSDTKLSDTKLSDTKLSDMELEYLETLAAYVADENAIAETF